MRNYLQAKITYSNKYPRACWSVCVNLHTGVTFFFLLITTRVNIEVCGFSLLKKNGRGARVAYIEKERPIRVAPKKRWRKIKKIMRSKCERCILFLVLASEMKREKRFLPPCDSTLKIYIGQRPISALLRAPKRRELPGY